MGLGEKCTLVKEQNSIYITFSVLFQTNMKKRYDMSYEHQIVALHWVQATNYPPMVLCPSQNPRSLLWSRKTQLDLRQISLRRKYSGVEPDKETCKQMGVGEIFEKIYF